MKHDYGDDEGERSTAPLEKWRQGDFTLDAPDFFFAVPLDENTEADLSAISWYDVWAQLHRFCAVLLGENTEADLSAISWYDVRGWVVVSQTCDIVRITSDRPSVIVCPLVEITDPKILESGTKPNLVPIKNAPDPTLAADLSQMATVSKQLLAKLNRCKGFDTDDERSEFAAALERKFGRFAFPGPFNDAIRSFANRARSASRKANPEKSKPAQIYQSIKEIRVRPNPGFDADCAEITFFVLLEPLESRPIKAREAISEEISNQVSQINLPDGMNFTDPAFFVLNYSDMTAEEYKRSYKLDLGYLSLGIR